MSWKFFKSTGFYLFVFSILISIIPLTAIQLTSHHRAKQELLHNIKTKIDETSETAKRLFFERLREEKEGLKLLTQISPLRKDFIAEYFFVYRKNFARISVLDSQGEQLYSFDSNLELSPTLPKPYEERIDMEGISRDIAARIDETTSLGLFPIPDGYAERMIVKTETGFILCDIRLTKVLSDITDELNLKSNEELIILDEENIVIYSRNPAQLSQKIEPTEGQKFSSYGENILIGFTELESKMRFGLKVDYESLLESINRSLRFGLFLTIIIAVFILIFIFFSVRWLTRPMSSLIKGADQIAQGNFGQRITINRPEELKALAMRFNEMAESLKHVIKEKTQSESFAAIGKFASYFAHDIKSPLEGTYLIASEMRKNLASDDPNREYLEEVITGINRMRGMVKGALDFSRASNLNLESIDLNLLIKRVASEFQVSHTSRISLHLESNLPLIPLDSILIQRVFQNLFENSYEARRNGCHISVKTEKRAREVFIEVRDDGKGMGREMLSRIFEPFKSSKEKGYGFGLAFVREVIKSHQGTISVESELGKGTKFNFSLPIKEHS